MLACRIKTRAAEYPLLLALLPNVAGLILLTLGHLTWRSRQLQYSHNECSTASDCAPDLNTACLPAEPAQRAPGGCTSNGTIA